MRTNKEILVTLLVAVSLSNMAWAVDCPIPDTGQTKCYDDTQEITCPSPGQPFYGQDAQYITNPQSYTKLDENGSDLPDDATTWVMVRDNVTGLIWEVKESKDDLMDYNNPHDADNEYYWSDSLRDGTGTEDFINALNTPPGFDGFTDWRMPTIKELSFIVNSGTKSGPDIDQSYFPNTNTVAYGYWSSIPNARFTEKAWFVSFGLRRVPTGNKFRDKYVRAVRGGQFSNNFNDNLDGTVTDTATGLMW